MMKRIGGASVAVIALMLVLGEGVAMALPDISATLSGVASRRKSDDGRRR
jgi:hypothetical protein